MVDIRLYALVDASLGREKLPGLARLAASGGATLIQYRDKTGSTRQMIECAEAIRASLKGSGVPLLVNDRVDVVLASGAGGVHLGREDMSADQARAILGPDAIIGLTVKNEEDAAVAGAAPVDYACIGGVFETLSKHNPDAPVGLDGLSRLRRQLRDLNPTLPVGAIAGIELQRTPEAIAAGADGVSVISAIFRAADPRAATLALRQAVGAALERRNA
ncbi:thiamine phosphate synthase [Mesorhizobium sp. RP14(2022)]|uniref:Thiamine-phosphate synthase n=1 Tax=Mesorhizobium liriopis TaxID=2953882 RepID=A0ABT1C4F4_9HYPH|nr:thiamine phosphate synthase [Mesorhizobium liriopis]MCO6049021.1 thiamine phosphate synthase [Mesorhizobium liriopis]